MGNRSAKPLPRTPSYTPPLPMHLPDRVEVDFASQTLGELTSYSSENIHTLDVLAINGTNYSFVHRLHPVILFLKRNALELNIRFEHYLLVDSNWYRLENDTFRKVSGMIPTPFPRLASLDDVI